MSRVRLAELMVKRTSLAAESKIIRKQEIKWRDRARRAKETRKNNPEFAEIAKWTRLSLYLHRVLVVGPATRYAHVANAFLRGKPYFDVEQKVYANRLNGVSGYSFIKRIAENAHRFSDNSKSLEQVTRDVIMWLTDHPGWEAMRGAYSPEDVKKYGDLWADHSFVQTVNKGSL